VGAAMTPADTSHAIEMMERYGGSFILCLAKAWRHADPQNRQKIEETWLYEFERYADMSVPGEVVK
jgi:hypothetical protein